MLQYARPQSGKAKCIEISSIAKGMTLCVIMVLFIDIVLIAPVIGVELLSSNASQMQTGWFAKVLASPMEVAPDDIVLDVSPSATRYIEGAISIDYESFMSDGGQLKPVSEMAELLGEAGISNNDSLVITGECLPCGGGPSPAVFTYWLLRYLGHENVRLLDGSIEDWAAAGLNTSNESAVRPEADYTLRLKPELLANYDFVLNGGAQIVDVRPSIDFAIGSIPGALNIPSEDVLFNESLKGPEDLQQLFAGLENDRPVVVYSNVGIEASLVWLALTLSGYDARLYTWRDWLENKPKFSFDLIDVEASPNPVRSGEAATITASFQQTQIKAADNSSPNDEVKLTVKGCATCGFEGFSLGATGNKSGMVKLGSSGKTTSSGGFAAEQPADSSLRCTFIVNGADGTEVARTALLRTSGYKYAGIWNANVAPGVYRISIDASASGISKIFSDILLINVI